MKLHGNLRNTKIRLYKTSILSGALFFLSFHLTGQDTIQEINRSHLVADSVILTKKGKVLYIDRRNDTLNIKNDTVLLKSKPKWIPEPQRATILSAVLPGLGQVYNRKYWKVPILYAAGGVLYYYYYINNELYLKNKKLYEEEIAKGADGSRELKDKYSKDLNEFSKKRDYKIILIGVFYIANIVDAMADAYFATYDISNDLSFKMKPSLIPEPYLSTTNFSYGFTLSLNF